jgi:general secretion pathway protein G
MIRALYSLDPIHAMNFPRHALSLATCGRRAQHGFTLIEIMVVVVILGILAALVAPNVIRRVDDARVTKAKQDIRAYETALNLYRMDNFRYPTTEQGL